MSCRQLGQGVGGPLGRLHSLEGHAWSGLAADGTAGGRAGAAHSGIRRYQGAEQHDFNTQTIPRGLLVVVQSWGERWVSPARAWARVGQSPAAAAAAPRRQARRCSAASWREIGIRPPSGPERIARIAGVERAGGQLPAAGVAGHAREPGRRLRPLQVRVYFALKPLLPHLPAPHPRAPLVPSYGSTSPRSPGRARRAGPGTPSASPCGAPGRALRDADRSGLLHRVRPPCWRCETSVLPLSPQSGLCLEDRRHRHRLPGGCWLWTGLPPAAAAAG